MAVVCLGKVAGIGPTHGIYSKPASPALRRCCRPRPASAIAAVDDRHIYGQDVANFDTLRAAALPAKA
ncbi:hypothetical protein [Nonomuraea recticatena]|uniref:Uncharacterized protein n=1 Tax=Nonomuraea recticatena TaxID=46178 RepID=A0ABN3R941_9ACTN